MTDLRVTGPNSDGEYWLHIEAGGMMGGINLGASHGPMVQRLLDAAAIKAPVQEPVAEVVRDVWGRCERLEDEAYSKLEKSTELTEHELGFWRGQKTTAKQIRRATEMPATPQPDETAALLAKLAEMTRKANGLLLQKIEAEADRDEERKLADDLIAIVEGIDGAMNHGTWRDDKGTRLKDTPQWVALYNAARRKEQQG